MKFKILALHSGGLAGLGTAAQIMTPARLKAIYGLDMDVIAHPVTGHPLAIAR